MPPWAESMSVKSITKTPKSWPLHAEAHSQYYKPFTYFMNNEAIGLDHFTRANTYVVCVGQSTSTISHVITLAYIAVRGNANAKAVRYNKTRVIDGRVYKGMLEERIKIEGTSLRAAQEVGAHLCPSP